MNVLKKILKRIIEPFRPFLVKTKAYQRYLYIANVEYVRQKRNINKKKANKFIYSNSNKIKQYDLLFRNITISINRNSRFQYWIDEDLCFMNTNQVNDSLPPDYSLILDNSIDDLIQVNKDYKNLVQKNNYFLLISVSKYVKRIIDKLTIESSDNIIKTKHYFERMLTNKTDSLEEAFQRILFWNSLFWQTRHFHVGLGSLDQILNKYTSNLSDKKNEELIKDFYSELHNYYTYKSLSLMGDTGQLIILGGKNSNGNYFCNHLTYSFIKVLKEQKSPDPKLLLRVTNNMPQDLIELAIDCNSTGIGSPLLSNDDKVIPALEAFGYSHEDACNYVTSACWEPFCYKNSLGRSNMNTINFAMVLVNFIYTKDFLEINTFESFITNYCIALEKYMKVILNDIDKIRWEKNPLMSFFIDNCSESGKDISEGGAVHNDYGILSVGLGNTVDSLLNIKYLVFETNKYSLNDIKKILISNFLDNEELRKQLADKTFFAHDDYEVLSLINRITTVVENACARYKNYLGGRVKFGLSSPVYIDEGKKTNATFDGRKAFSPLSVHISAKLGEPYTELLNFAGKLNYNGIRSNGNVVDFFVSPNFIQNNFYKFCTFIKAGIQIGFYQMQMNVVSSETLIAAKKNPGLYPNLIVRVWGFSAYFKDLPEQYKELLIQRALESEKVA